MDFLTGLPNIDYFIKPKIDSDLYSWTISEPRNSYLSSLFTSSLKYLQAGKLPNS
jgi:hypothetical protein